MSTMTEIHNPAKSGAKFYKSADASILMKTISSNEINFFVKHMLKAYFNHVEKNRTTLLVQIYGIFGFSCPYMATNAVLIMKNIFPNQVSMHEIYDLKGSTLNRLVNKLF